MGLETVFDLPEETEDGNDGQVAKGLNLFFLRLCGPHSEICAVQPRTTWKAWVHSRVVIFKNECS